MTHSSMAISYEDLPEELVLEIISWLPAKAIPKFKYANHDILSLVTSQSYLSQKQSHNSFLKNDPCFFLHSDTCQRYSATTEFHHFSSVEKSSSGVSHNFLDFLKNYPSCRIMASSNGLILGRSTKCNGEIELFISNPATKSWLPIPTPDYLKENLNFDINIAFECNNQDSHSNDYMLFRFEAPDEWPYIMSYNIEDGGSRMIRVPKEARRNSHDFSCKMGIYKWGKARNSDESICLVRLRKCVFTVWVLVDYEASKWRRILKIRVKEILGIKEEDPIIVRGFKVINGDYLVFATQKKVYGYGLGCKIYMKLQKICEHQFDHDGDKVCFTSYSDTLRSCGDGATTLPLMQQSY
ncbi:F-box protein [Senna tora]|uniref:F-box protein n=1 Tax=Senna tora TaxID=362788 RepID=A0A834X6P3_9FABA|nr:F-box protein [Senna tora]